MKANLNERFLRGLKAPEQGRDDYWDEKQRGLVLRVSAKSWTWFLFYRDMAGTNQRYKLGRYPEISANAARGLAAEKLVEISRGADPAAERRAQRRAPDQGRIETFQQLAESYLERHAAKHKKKRSAHEDYKSLDCDILPFWCERKATELERKDVVQLLDRIVDRGAGVKANRVQALLSKIFNFGMARAVLKSNPVLGMSRQVREQPRTRCLSEQEIRVLWGVLDAFDSTNIGDAYKLMLLTGQRVGEILGMCWPEVSPETGWWEIPVERYKTHIEHRVPLAQQAMEILRRRKAAACSEHVFPSQLPLRPITSINKCHEKIKNACGFDFQARDLRRTAITGCAAVAGRFIATRVAGHVDRSITAIYDKHEYANEKRSALWNWDAKVREIVTGELPSKVVDLFPVAESA